MAGPVPNKRARAILTDVLTLPTAPFAEHFVLDFIRAFCAERSVRIKADAAGNLLARVRRGQKRTPRPVCLQAHTDHPGFVADRMLDKGNVRAFWRGGVPREYFVGAGVRFRVDGRWVRGRVETIQSRRCEGQTRVYSAAISCREEIPQGAIGMWDLPDPRFDGKLIHARACDDLAGVAALLSCIDALVRSKRSCEAYFLFTRAEEVGFVGAIAAADAGTVPRKCFVVTMETSSQLPSARIGDGPILRVGDKATAFSPAATAHCQRVASVLAKADADFVFQRKLMDGGTCESSVFCNKGYDATGICIALGNYHNVNRDKKKIDAEYVSLTDYDNVVKWFIELARGKVAYSGKDETFIKRMATIGRTYAELLENSRKTPC